MSISLCTVFRSAFGGFQGFESVPPGGPTHTVGQGCHPRHSPAASWQPSRALLPNQSPCYKATEPGLVPADPWQNWSLPQLMAASADHQLCFPSADSGPCLPPVDGTPRAPVPGLSTRLGAGDLGRLWWTFEDEGRTQERGCTVGTPGGAGLGLGRASLFSFISQRNKKACAKRTSPLGFKRDGSVQKAFQAQAGDKGVVRESYLPWGRHGTHHEAFQYQARHCGFHFSP